MKIEWWKVAGWTVIFLGLGFGVLVMAAWILKF